MKTLSALTNHKTRHPILKTIHVSGNVARATNLDIDIFTRVEGLGAGIYEGATFGGLNVKSSFDLADYPQAIDNNKTEKASVSISLDDLQRLEKAMSTEETRYYLCGIFLDGKNKAFITTDGHRLCKIPMLDYDGPEHGVILPAVAVKFAIKACKESKVKSVLIWLGKTKAGYSFELSCGNIWIVSKHVDGTFPEYQRVFPNVDKAKPYKWDVAAYKAIYKDIKALQRVKGDRVAAVKLNGGIEFEGQKFEFAPSPIAIGFNAAFLADLDSGDMLINDASGPVLVNHDNERQTVLMPMRV